MAQQGCCSPAPRTLPVLRTPASHAPPPSPPHRPLGGGNGLLTGCASPPQRPAHPRGWSPTGGRACSNRVPGRGQVRGLPRSPPVPPPHAHSGEDAVRGHGGSGTGERPAPQESPRPSSLRRRLGTHALPGSCRTGRAGVGRRGWGRAGGSGPPLSFPWGSGASGLRGLGPPGRRKPVHPWGRGSGRGRGLYREGSSGGAGPVRVGPGAGGARDLELREVGGAQVEG